MEFYIFISFRPCWYFFTLIVISKKFEIIIIKRIYALSGSNKSLYMNFKIQIIDPY